MKAVFWIWERIFALPFMNFGRSFSGSGAWGKSIQKQRSETKKSKRIKQDRFCSES